MNSTAQRFCRSAPHFWVIVLLLPTAQHRIIARFRNRQDADDQLRFLRRAVPGAKFEIVFHLKE